jgi:hypothetical protein
MTQEETAPVVEEEQPEEEDLHWSKKPDADQEAVVEFEELSSRFRKIVGARQSIPRRQWIRIISVTIYIIFQCYILYMNIGSAFAAYTFIFCATGVIICLDDLSMARKLGKLRNGEEG